jgi:Tol biopolymer transport system component
MRRALFTVLTLAVLLVCTGVAEAAFPGQNGKIAYVHDDDIWTVEPDGSGATQITSGPARDAQPNWSPDGKQIAFMSTREDLNPGTCTSCWDMYAMDADGTDVRLVGNFGTWPAWSPDGTRIAFASQGHLWTIAADGTDQQRVDADPSDPQCYQVYGPPLSWSPDGKSLASNAYSDCYEHEYPIRCFVDVATGADFSCWEAEGEAAEDWSPDSHHVVIGTDGEGNQGIYRRGVPDCCYIELNPPFTPFEASEGYLGNAAWSPDGTTIIFRRDPYQSSSELYLIDAGGGNRRPFPGLHIGCCYDWQPIPINAYPRPKGASPLQVSLVPAYQPCTAPNRTHGPPLAFPSCAPPQRTPGQLTIGTADSNGKPTKSVSIVQIGVRPGNPSTPADEADLRLFGTVNDVRVASDLSDYTGQLEARMSLRITDKDNTPHPGGPGAATTQDLSYSFPIPCSATSDTTVGGECSFETTAEAFAPGLVKELRRSIWQLGDLRVYDGSGGLFMTQGVFVP